ncbi:hypothetical protein OUZ56_020300 [Daphnia magna]|uniref:Uncharacterized protein n=1 Tax=Daphnia magna TaxID=35525 RepID=A0ABQ9ZE42_9CRUS|nr:hypothetical protein OUZ56_020300 [Daphnia magna]
MATQTDEVQSIFDKVRSSSKVEDTVSFSSRRGSRSARALKFYVGNSRSKCTKERLQNLEKKSVANDKETTGLDGKADIFPENQQKETDVQADSNKGRGVDAFIPEENEEAKLSPKANQAPSRRPLRKQSLPEVDERLEEEKHSTHQNLNHVKENISTIDAKAAEAGLSEQMNQEPEKLLNDILSHPSKQKRRIAKYTPTKNTKISEVRPRRSKQQPRLDKNPVNRVENSPDDSKNFVDVKEIMKDMSKLLPHIVLQRVPFPRVAAPSQLQLAEQQESSANHDKEEQSRSETALSSLEEGGSRSAELGSLHPIEENCLILDVFLSGDKKEDDAKLKSTVIVQSATDPEVVPEESISKEKSCISENIENSVAADGPAVILDVNLDICVEGGGHVGLNDVKITGQKRSVSSQEVKKSPEVKSLRGRLGRTPKAMAVEPVKTRGRIVNSRRKLAEPSLDPFPSRNSTDVTEKPEAIQSLGVTAKEKVVHENVQVISEKKGSHAEEQKFAINSVVGLPDNMEIVKENDADAVSSITSQEEIKIVDLEEAASNEEVNLLTGVKPSKILRERRGREPTTGKIKDASGQFSDAETTNSSVVTHQTSMEKSLTSTGKEK